MSGIFGKNHITNDSIITNNVTNDLKNISIATCEVRDKVEISHTNLVIRDSEVEEGVNLSAIINTIPTCLIQQSFEGTSGITVQNLVDQKAQQKNGFLDLTNRATDELDNSQVHNYIQNMMMNLLESSCKITASSKIEDTLVIVTNSNVKGGINIITEVNDNTTCQLSNTSKMLMYSDANNQVKQTATIDTFLTYLIIGAVVVAIVLGIAFLIVFFTVKRKSNPQVSMIPMTSAAQTSGVGNIQLAPTQQQVPQQQVPQQQVPQQQVPQQQVPQQQVPQQQVLQQQAPRQQTGFLNTLFGDVQATAQQQTAQLAQQAAQQTQQAIQTGGSRLSNLMRGGVPQAAAPGLGSAAPGLGSAAPGLGKEIAQVLPELESVVAEAAPLMV